MSPVANAIALAVAPPVANPVASAVILAAASPVANSVYLLLELLWIGWLSFMTQSGVYKIFTQYIDFF